MGASRTALRLSLLLLEGCFLSTDLSGFAGPTGATAAVDAGAGATTDAPHADVSADAVRRFCASGVHAFCDDFDEGGFLARWDGPVIQPKGSLAASTLRSISAPAALLAATERLQTGDPETRALVSRRWGDVKAVRIECDVRVESPAFAENDGNVSMLEVRISTAAGSRVFFVFVGIDYTTLSLPGAMVNGPAFPTDTWQHARIELDPAGTITATVGDSRWKERFPALATGAMAETELRLGLTVFNRPTPPFNVFYDNVTIDFP